MEKLQAALEKAREKRGDGHTPTGVSQVAAPNAPVPRAGASALEERWEALPAFDADSRALRKNRVFFEDSNAIEATSFDVLRTKVLLQMEKNGWKRLAVTSAGSGAGKSTVFSNLASSISRQI